MSDKNKNFTKTQHISSAFDKDLEAIQTQIIKMGGIVEQAIIDMCDALKNNDIEMITNICASDAEIDALEEHINADVVRLIALRAPTAGDLRTVLCVMKMSSNLERIGDYTKNIGRRALVLLERPLIPATINSIRMMAREVTQMLKDVLDAYTDKNAELAENVRARDEHIDEIYSSLFREFVTYMLEDQRHITPCLHLHFIAKNIERIGDHVTNIAEQIIYMTTGQLPSDKRSKKESIVSKTP